MRKSKGSGSVFWHSNHGCCPHGAKKVRQKDVIEIVFLLVSLWMSRQEKKGLSTVASDVSFSACQSVPRFKTSQQLHALCLGMTSHPGVWRLKGGKKKWGLTLGYLSQMKAVDPGDLAEGAWSVKHHHEADWTPRPVAKQTPAGYNEFRKLLPLCTYIHRHSFYMERFHTDATWRYCKIITVLHNLPAHLSIKPQNSSSKKGKS